MIRSRRPGPPPQLATSILSLPAVVGAVPGPLANILAETTPAFLRCPGCPCWGSEGIPSFPATVPSPLVRRPWLQAYSWSTSPVRTLPGLKLL